MIYIVWAIPGGGKSYFGTYIALKEMFKRKPKKVYSNYPIIHHQKQPTIKRIMNKIPVISYSKSNGIKFTKKEPLLDIVYSSYIWEDKYIYTGLTNAVIILDEAYRDFSSKESPKFTKDKHTFFATNRHNELDIYVIAQHPSRIEVIIREMCNVFYFVSKWINPINGNPLWFTIEGYLSEEDFKLRKLKKDMRYSKQRISFNKKVANAYDTHYFRKEAQVNPVKWSEIDIKERFTIKKEEEKESQSSKDSFSFV